MSSENQKSLFSQRANDLLTEFRFAESQTPKADFHWRIEYSGGNAQLQSDKILTLKYSSPVQNDIDNIFLESICRLSKDKTLQFLFALTFREIESFLRDENHIPAFDSTIENEAMSALTRVKKSLIVEILLQKLSLSGPLSGSTDWRKLTLVEKNRAVSSLLKELGQVFPEGKKAELVLAEEDMVTVRKNDFPLDLEILEAILGHIFYSHESISPLKVIGTL